MIQSIFHKTKSKGPLLTVGMLLLLLLGVSEALALTPEEADRAIQRGLESQSIRSASEFYVIRKFSSQEAIARGFVGGAGSANEYTLLVRSCRQLLRFAAFQSKTNDAIDLGSLRSSCIAQDRVWIIIAQSSPNLLTSGVLEKLTRRPKRQQTVAAVTGIEVVLDGKVVEPLGQMDLKELGSESSTAIFPAEPFLEAERGQIKVTTGETKLAVGELKSELLRRMFGQQ